MLYGYLFIFNYFVIVDIANLEINLRTYLILFFNAASGMKYRCKFKGALKAKVSTIVKLAKKIFAMSSMGALE